VKEMKIKYVIDLAQQHREKNIDWGDYPTIGLDSIGRIRKGNRLGKYYQRWEEYYDDRVKTGIEERINNRNYFTKDC